MTDPTIGNTGMTLAEIDSVLGSGPPIFPHAAYQAAILALCAELRVAQQRIADLERRLALESEGEP